MARIALNFICKNESHVIQKMLDSTRPVIDLIVAVDTGSTDNTIQTIQTFGKQYGIPTYVFERPFDNYGNSRNHAREKLLSTVDELSWNREEVWGAFIDCDESITIPSHFKKTNITKDVYYITVKGQSGSFTRQFLFHLSKSIWWKYPIHEILFWEDKSVSEEMLDNSTYIFTHNSGASWKLDPETKFLNHANLLTKYIDEGNGDYRCLIYAGNSYMTAMQYSRSNTKRRELLNKARHYYTEALALKSKNTDDNIRAQRRLGEIRVWLEEGWSDTQFIFLQAYAMDPRCAESISRIIDHYISQKKWSISYIFTYFARKKYHNNNPIGIVARTEDSLYQWGLLFHHYLASYFSSRLRNAHREYHELKNQIRVHPEYFSTEDVSFILQNAPVKLYYRKLKNIKKKLISRSKYFMHRSRIPPFQKEKIEIS